MADQKPAPPASPTPDRPPQTAVAPLNTIAAEDIGEAASNIDKWLRRISGDYVTLERLTMVAGSIPVIGNIMALVDVIGDVVTVVEKYLRKEAADFLDWVSLGINVIGVIPAPGTSTARMTLRPTLHLVRQELMKGVKNIGETIVTVLVAHLNDKLAGEIETFVEGAMGRLGGLLEDCAKFSDQVIDALIDVLRRCLGDKPLFDVPKAVAVEHETHNSQVQSRWERLLAAAVRMEKEAANYVAAQAVRLLPAECKALVGSVIAGLTDIKGHFRQTLVKLADKEAPQSIHWLLNKLLQAVAQRLHTRTVIVPAVKGTQVTHERPGHGLEAIKTQAPACADGNCYKQGQALARSVHSISYATGSETFTHTDFMLQAQLPIEWSRTYYSHAVAFDQGSVGARWLTPYGSRVDVKGRGRKRSLVHHGADGRSHTYPWLEPGHSHRDSIEEVTLTRANERLLVLDFGKPLAEGQASPWREIYELVDTVPSKVERVGQQHFRLIAQQTLNQAAIELRYDHVLTEGPNAGEQVLSDILSLQGGEVVAHVGLQPDALSGRILAVWQIEDGALKRQLAAYEYDEHGDLMQAQDEDGAAWRYAYRNHLVTRYTDRTGRGMNLHYDHHGEDGDPPALPKAIREWADDGSHDTRLEWDKNIRLTYVTDALGGETWVYYDIQGYTYRVIHPDQREEWFFRDDAKNVIRHIHSDGSADGYRYDAVGNLTRHLRADGSAVHFEYDQGHRLTGVLDADGNVWRRDHDVQGHMVEETDPLGHKTQYAYDKAGRPIEVTDAKGGKKKLAYTADGRLASYTDCSSRTTKWAYDERGRLASRTDALGHATRYRYTPPTAEGLQAAYAEVPGNHPGRLEAIQHADDSQERLVHDAEGRLLSHTDALQRKTRYAYTAAGQVAQRIDAQGHRLGYRWDQLGRLTELRNENDQPYRFRYDPVGRLLEETGFDGKATQYRYAEATGVLAEVIDGGVTTRLKFDAMGRLAQRQVTTAQDEQTEVFGYYPGGALGEARNEHARLQWFYDAAGNLTREHQGYLAQGKTAIWQHRYDELNQRTGTTRPDGRTLEWLTYGSGHVHGLLLDGQERVGFERDALHREVHRLQDNGLQQSQAYDPVGRLLQQQLGPAQSAGQSTVQSKATAQPHLRTQGTHGTRLGMPPAIVRRYSYDQAGQLDHIEDSRRGRLQYRYDTVGRLLQATGGISGTVEHFAFDPAGNILAAPQEDRLRPVNERVKLPAVLDNLLKEYAGTNYRYDERGNLVERIQNGRSSRFEWDEFNRMVRAVTAHGATTYTYDPLGRRIGKRIVQGERVTETLYGWDGDTLAFESTGDEGRGRTVHYVHEAGSFVPLLQMRQDREIELAPTTDVQALMRANRGEYDLRQDPMWNGDFEPQPQAFAKEEIAFYQCDHLGTPQELTDHEGNVAWEANYRAWGLAKTAIGDAARKAGFTNNIRFQGQYLDEETGLHYNRHRYYDPVIGRFVSSDPIGLKGGLNLHAYARNPIIFIDPLGLATLSHAPDFDSARQQAFENAGMTDPDKVAFSKFDPNTGTVVEFKGEGGAKVAYDAPHADMDPTQGHDKPHVGWQTAGKRSAGCALRGNITYYGAQHPHRPDEKTL